MEVTSTGASWRFRAGLILLAGLAAYAGLQSLYYYNIRYYQQRLQKFGIFASDEVSLYEQRFACLRGRLEPGEAAGFLSPLAGDARIEARLLTQYALAPAVITADEEQERLVAVYAHPKELRAALPAGFQLLADCGNGVGLLGKTGGP